MFKLFKNVIDWFTAPVPKTPEPTHTVAATIKQAVTEGAVRGTAKPRNRRRRKPRAPQAPTAGK